MVGLEGIVEPFPVAGEEAFVVGIDLIAIVWINLGLKRSFLPGFGLIGDLFGAEAELAEGDRTQPTLVAGMAFFVADGLKEGGKEGAIGGGESRHIGLGIIETIALHGLAHMLGGIHEVFRVVALDMLAASVDVAPFQEGFVGVAEDGAMAQGESFGDEVADEAIEEPAIGLSVACEDLFDVVDGVVDAGEALVRPGVGVDMHGDAEAVESVGFGGRSDGFGDHILGDLAVGAADQFVDEGAGGILVGGEVAVAGEEVEGEPDVVVGEFAEVAVVEEFVGGTDAAEHGPVVEFDHAGLGGVIDVLGTVGDRASVWMLESGHAGQDVGYPMMKVYLHLHAPKSRPDYGTTRWGKVSFGGLLV